MTKNKVYYKDSRSMKEVPDNSVHCIITSPPYFSIKDYSKDGYQRKSQSDKQSSQIGDIKNFNAYISELLKVWKESYRVLTPNGKLIINTPLMPMLKQDLNTHFNRHIFDINSEIQQSILGNTEFYLFDVYIWNRTNSAKKLMFGSYPYPRNFYAQNTMEFITIYVKDGKSMNDIAKTKKHNSKLTQKEWIEYTKQIWDISIPNKKDSAYGKHPAIMPEEIPHRCIKMFTFEGDTVLDPFAGSGTTLKIAKKMKRNYIGYEIMKIYKSCIVKKLNESNNTVKLTDDYKSKTTRNKIKLNKLYTEDCLNFLDKIDDQTIDLAVIDPPYGLGVAEWDTFKSHEEFLNFTFNWIDKLLPKLKDTASLYIFNTSFNSSHILKYIHESNLIFQNWIIWDKRDGFSATKKRFVNSQEAILFFTTSHKYTFNYNDVRIPYESENRIEHAKKKGIIKNGKRWYPNPNGKLCGEIWHFSSERHNSKINGKTMKLVHKTVKPYSLIERIVKASSNKNDLVLDCFVGSGTTALVCKNLKRNFVCCDNNPEYILNAKKRIRTGVVSIELDK